MINDSTVGIGGGTGEGGGAASSYYSPPTAIRRHQQQPHQAQQQRGNNRIRRLVPCRPVCLWIPALILIALGVAFLAGGGPLVRAFVRSQLPLDNPNRLVFNVWRDTAYEGISVKRRFVVYSVNNAAEVIANRVKPEMVRHGPYVFREWRHSPEEDIYYGADGTVGFKYHDDLTFIPEESVDDNGNLLTLDDMMTVPNMPFFALMHRLKHFPGELSRSLACDVLSPKVDGISDTGIFTRRSVRHLLFGYTDPLLSEFKALTTALHIDYEVPTFFRFLWNGTLPAPSPISYATGQRCPLWDDMSVCNQTTVNDTKVWSGAGWGVDAPLDPDATEAEVASARRGITNLPRGVEDVGSTVHWAGNDHMWWWGDAATYGGDCQEFEGGAGMTYPSNLDSKSTPYVFVDSIYRKVKFAFAASGSVKGVPVMRFTMDPDEHSTDGPNARCYMQEYKGAFNMKPVVFAPLVVTSNAFADFGLDQPLKDPAFTYEGDARLALNITIDGLNPADVIAAEQGTLTSFLDIFGDAGMLLEGAARLQSNVMFQPPNILGCENSFEILKPRHDAATNTTIYFPETLVPIFSLSREAVVSDEVAAYIRDHVLVFFKLAYALGGVCIALGVLLGAAGAVAWNNGSTKHLVAAQAAHEAEGSWAAGHAAVPHDDRDTMPSISNRVTPRGSGGDAAGRKDAGPHHTTSPAATAFALRKRGTRSSEE